ncbi:hypothetical protein JZ751_019927 [Albula glossodonta]|uniref:Uncharacterized protein n=1 Tax=Albula glossodonta TaxID=121402 RepID=A0A8T2MSY4_9TELE|nr:hypothetical protein JZ751_019927 [Albula glossodonta]
MLGFDAISSVGSSLEVRGSLTASLLQTARVALEIHLLQVSWGVGVVRAQQVYLLQGWQCPECPLEGGRETLAETWGRRCVAVSDPVARNTPRPRLCMAQESWCSSGGGDTEDGDEAEHMDKDDWLKCHELFVVQCRWGLGDL